MSPSYIATLDSLKWHTSPSMAAAATSATNARQPSEAGSQGTAAAAVAPALAARPPVCVTGATGFVGVHIVEELLRCGYTVHATVRNPDAAKVAHLRSLVATTTTANGGTPRLRLFAADLTKPGSFDEAIAGCNVVVHSAAVVQEYFDKDPMAEVVQPGIDGVRNVVASCEKYGVKRIVFTGSVSTVRQLEATRSPDRRGKPFNEEEFGAHPKLSPTYGTYNYAKYVAEKEIFSLWKGSLISILPSWCIGPQRTKDVTSSQQMLKMLALKQYPLVPRAYLELVDVRDVAVAHRLAVETTAVHRDRFIASGGVVRDAGEFARLVNEVCPTLAVPTRMMPWFVLWCSSWWEKRVTPFFLNERAVAAPPFDNSKIERVLGLRLSQRDVKASIADALRSFMDYGILPKQYDIVYAEPFRLVEPTAAASECAPTASA